MKYTVANAYGIAGNTTHATATAALKARDKREGDGWVVTDDDGNTWDNMPGIGGADRPCIVHGA